jgi:hypothetical protein
VARCPTWNRASHWSKPWDRSIAGLLAGSPEPSRLVARRRVTNRRTPRARISGKGEEASQSRPREARTWSADHRDKVAQYWMICVRSPARLTQQSDAQSRQGSVRGLEIRDPSALSLCVATGSAAEVAAIGEWASQASSGLTRRTRGRCYWHTRLAAGLRT